MRVPEANPPQVGAKRLQYVGRRSDWRRNGDGDIRSYRDVVNACQHANGIFPAALALHLGLCLLDSDSSFMIGPM